MDVSFTLNFTWVLYALAYLLVGALGALVYQAKCHVESRLTIALSLFWMIFWLPAGVILLCILAIGVMGS